MPFHFENKPSLIAYVTCGDPNLATTREVILAAIHAGASLIELGVPFSDPLADGPVIQRASERALKAGTTLKKILDRLPGWCETVRAPVILFTYYNPILRYGLDDFARDVREAGADGALVVDLTPEEAAAYLGAMRAHNLDPVFLASPTSPDVRLARLAEASQGFLYLISRTGVTDEREAISSALKPLVERVPRCTSLPLAVGFGL